MNSTPKGLLFSSWLREKGYSAQLLKRYRDYGWFETLVPGVMFRREDKLSALAALYSYNTQMGQSVRIAAHSALEYQGFSHYVPMGKPKLVLALNQSAPPRWVKSDKFDRQIETFSTDAFENPHTLNMEIQGLNLIVSAPEQAFLECLNLVPNQYNYMDLYYIMEQLGSLDPKKVTSALKNTSKQKVKRMFLYMAEKAQHPWFKKLNLNKLGLTDSKLQLVQGGVYNATYKITVPKELHDYE